MKKTPRNLTLATAALCLASNAFAQSQWWWERFDAASKVNVEVPAVGNLPALISNPTGGNVKLNKSNSTQPALVVVGSAIGGAAESGYTTADLQIALSNGLSTLPINSTPPNYVFTVKNTGAKFAAASVTYASRVTGAATLTLGGLTCLAVPAGGSCVVAGSPEKAAIGIPAGGAVTLTMPASIGTGLGSISLTGTVIGNSGVVDTNTANNVATVTNTVVGGSTDISVTISDANQASILSDIDNRYTIVLANSGPSRADVFMWPFVSTTGATSYSVRDMKLTGSGGATGTTARGLYSLPAGSSVTIEMVIRPTGGAGTITVSPMAYLLTPNTTEANTANNVATDTNTVTPPPPRPDGVPANAPVYVNNLAGAGAYDIIFGDGIFYAMTTDPTFNLVSVDGVNWYKTPRPFPAASQVVPMYGNGVLIETMADATLGYKFARSTDNGQSWTIGTLPVAGLYIAQAYAEGRFVAIAASDTATFTAANSDTILYSNDGLNWSVQQMPYSVRWYDVASNGREFVAVSLTDNRAAYSAQGQIWNAVTLPGKASTTYGTIAAGNGRFVTLSRTGGLAATSTDGKTWGSGPVTNISWSAIAYGNGKFAAVAEGYNVLAQSADGLNWSYSYPLAGNRAWKSLAFGNGVFVGVAMDSSTPIVFK